MAFFELDYEYIDTTINYQILKSYLYIRLSAVSLSVAYSNNLLHSVKLPTVCGMPMCVNFLMNRTYTHVQFELTFTTFNDILQIEFRLQQDVA